ncbi:hypothetical protein ACROYT_G038861 [Oculina patagonica]
MARKMMVKLLLLMMLSEVLLFSVSEAKPWFWRRRRRTPPRPPPCDSSLPARVAWVNSWKEYFSTYCPSSYSLRYWRSQHRNCKEDRIHYFVCTVGPVSYRFHNCAWTGHYVNDFDQPVHFTCPHNGFITGVRSEYSRHHRDRRFDFHCCHKNGSKAHSCKTTPYQNNWDQEINYWVPRGYYLVGVYSVHHNTHEDRRWKFEICQFGKFNGK